MKKVRILLTVLALAFAAAGTFASQYQPDTFVTGWEYIPGSPDRCIIQTSLCQPNQTTLCSINGHKVGDSNAISSQCGTQLFMP